MRVAVAVFWPYGLKIEGIRANIDALVDSARHAGHEVEVILSDVGARDFTGAPVHRYGGVGLAGAIVSVRGFRRVLAEIGGRFDLILCLMRFPSLAFVLDPLPEIIRRRLVAIFDGVLTGFELLPRAPNLQSLKLILGQHPWWLQLSRFRAGAYACSTQYQRRQMIAGGLPGGPDRSDTQRAQPAPAPPSGSGGGSDAPRLDGFGGGRLLGALQPREGSSRPGGVGPRLAG